MAARAAPAPAGLRGPWLCLLVALVALDVERVNCDQAHQAPIYLPVALELLDTPEHFRVQRVGHYPPANSSLSSRSETFLLLQPWPRAQPLLRASYPPFATQQVVPPRVTEPHQRPVPWDVRAVSVEAAVTPAEPHARVLFHLKGQDWPPGPGSLPCAWLHATHPAGTAHQACRFQPSLGACVVELEFPSHWFSQGSTTRAELAYTLEPAAEGPRGCGPGGEEEPGEQALPVGSVELHSADPPQYQEVPLDDAVTLRAPDVPVRPGQLFSATLLLRHNFTASLLTLRIKVKKGLHVTAARPAQPTLWTAKLDRFKGSKHHTTLITCHRAGHTEPDSSSPLELSEFLWVDFMVENGTGGGVAVTRPVTWQLEYPGQAPEAEKDKMVWEILVSERDIRALVPLAKAEELVNTAPLTGVPRRVPVRLVTVDAGGALEEVTEHVGCESANTQVLQVSEACNAVFVAGKETRGARGVRVDFWWRRLRASLRMTVWAPMLPLRIELTDSTLEQIRGWRVPGPTEGASEHEAGVPEEVEQRSRSCRLQYQRAGVRFLAPFVAHPLDGGRRLTHLLGPDWLLDVTHLVAPQARVQDPRVASLEGGHTLVGREPGVTSIEVRSPLSGSILGEQALAVTDDKVSVLELRAQPVMGISLALSRGTAHPGEVTATCWAQPALPAPKQEVALSLWLSFSDHTLAPAELYDRSDLGLTVSAEGPTAVLPAKEQGAQLGVLVSGASAEGLPLQVSLYPPEPCRRGRHRVPLASGTAWLGLPPAPTPVPALPSSPALSSLATEASIGGRRQVGGSVGVRGKFEQAEEKIRKEETEAREEEEEEEEEMVPAPQRVTDLELGMYALLGIFCLAILIFLVNGVVFVLRYQRKEPPDSSADPTSPQPHNWVWLGTDQEELSRQLDRRPPGLPKGEGGCPCENGAGGETPTSVSNPPGDPPGDAPGSSSTLARKEAGGRRKRVEFVTFAPAPPTQPPEEPVGAPAVQSILVAGEEDIRWVCEDMGLKDPEDLRNYMERIRGSS
ncbi:transmembrane protein 132A isoform 1-T1 [Thomomys bottae]